MMDYNRQKAKYLWLIEQLKNYNFETDIIMNIIEWDVQKGVIGFPNTYSLFIEYRDVPKSNIDLKFYLDQDGIWSNVEIIKIDIEERYQHHGFGRRLIIHTINIAKLVGVKRISGDILDKNNYKRYGD